MEVVLALRIIDTWAAQLQQPIKIDYRDFNLLAGEVREIDAADDVYVVEYADVGLRIESDLGYYDLENDLLNENQHRHGGMIRITNRLTKPRNISFIVGIAR